MQPIKAINSPVTVDSASVKSETIPIEVRSKAKANNRTYKKDKAHSLLTFSIDSDVVSISSGSGTSSSSGTINDSEILDASSISSSSGISLSSSIISESEIPDSISSKSEISYDTVKDDTYQKQL
ncbi:hypothetical protein [Wolbachia endosymbiont of Mansonella perstans]|uniref:hypothetical protein n=1 Tax=Wolbachia endosymbiont of Mansonella perstans TaxID=229526 RepID=UPI001CE17575|nr:hypothetical protein [Wolbachia endosymbiont of Mansonella perstans]MCA4773801.1 hypothetical protein [Wolbachia endosymbiont of Mansonella perstans]